MADPLSRILQRIFGTSSQRYVKRRTELVSRINSLEAEYARLSDEELAGKTAELRARADARKREFFGRPSLEELLAEMQEVPEDRRKTLKRRIIDGLNVCAVDILPDAFAAVREACKRHLPGHRHFDVQMIGGHVLHEGKIAEMATGEGKTLVATLPCYINVVLGLKVHVISTNDYLVKRDRDWMAPIYEALGVSSGAIQSEMSTVGPERKAQYACDITYGTNSELGFDYLRDNMKVRRDDQVQGPLHYAIVDEVDNILIDEARTPLIISGPARDDVNRYRLADRVARALVQKQKTAIRETQARVQDRDSLKARALKQGVQEWRFEEGIKKFGQDPSWLNEEEAQAIGHRQYYLVERDRKSVHMTHEGVTAAQEEAGIGSFYIGANMEWPHLIENALRAHVVYEREKEYVVQNGEVIIVDEFTGRLMHGRQWSEGLHQAVEAKEGVRVKEETQTLATITIQNYFKLYCKLAGMTGTAMTEVEEFIKIYGLDVVSIPTNRPVNRMDHNDRIYRTTPEKYKAIVEEIRAVSLQGFPNDWFVINDMIEGLKAAYKAMLAKQGTTGHLPPKDRCEEAIRRIEEAQARSKGDNDSLDPLREALYELTADLPGGRPVLVGTTSVENSEKLSNMLTKQYGIDHEVLNAKQVAREAEIVAKAGHRHAPKHGGRQAEGNVTISTNMAGRGTDIKLEKGVVHPPCIGDLGPKEPGVIATKCCINCPEYDGKCEHCFKPKLDPRFPELGKKFCAVEPPCGLHVVGTERHEARRIDNQLRGRSGRQGDPGSSRFFLSMQDDLLRFFAGDWVIKMLDWLGMEEGMAIENKRISKGIERAQKKVEERNFAIRKNLLEYDEVMDYQRQVFYRLRQRILEGRDLAEMVQDSLTDSIADAVDNFLDPTYPARCAAEWAKSELDVTMDPSRIDLDDFDRLESDLKDKAKDEARNTIEMSIGEYFDPDVERKDWDYRGLASWAMRRFNVNLGISQMNRMEPEEIQAMLVEAAMTSIDRQDCTPLKRYMEPTFGRSMLAEWVRAKFDLDVRLQQLRDLNPDQTREMILEKVHERYLRREIECPVDIALTVSLGQKEQTDQAYGVARLVDWANWKYRAGWTLEKLQNREVREIRSDLIRLSESYLGDGRLSNEVDEAVRMRRGEELAAWARERFGAELDGQALEGAAARESLLKAGREFLRRELTNLEQMVLLSIYDSAWKEHLLAMDHLKSTIGLRGYAEKDPKIEYKREGTQMFHRMLDATRQQVSDVILKVQVSGQMQARSVWGEQRAQHDASGSAFTDADREAAMQNQGEAQVVKPIKRATPKVKPNEPCPCGSGKKYKKCCGRNG